jgi:hypothetical protein
MTRQPILRPLWVRCLFLITLVFAFLILLTSSAKAQSTTWIITVDSTGSKPKPVYSVSPTQGGCPYQAIQDPENLQVCPGDTIQWQAKSTNKKSEIYLFHEDSIFDQNGTSPHGFQATDDKLTKAAQIKSDPSLQGAHEYYVAVFDKKTERVYVHDPKVIIGKGSPLELLEDMQEDCGPLVSGLANNSTAREQARAICEDVEKLKKLLNK